MLINKYTNDSLPVLSFIISTSVSLLFQCSTVSIFLCPPKPSALPPLCPYIENPAAAHADAISSVARWMTRPAGSENLQEHTGRVGSRSRRRGQEVTCRKPSFSVIYLLLVIELRVAVVLSAEDFVRVVIMLLSWKCLGGG